MTCSKLDPSALNAALANEAKGRALGTNYSNSSYSSSPVSSYASQRGYSMQSSYGSSRQAYGMRRY